jgi:hypothetical protein
MKHREILFHGGIVRTMESAASEKALLVRGNRIEAIGDGEQLRRQAPGAELIDLRGSTLLPGFIDTHTHFFEWARKISGVDLSGARTLDEVRERLRAQRGDESTPGVWLGGGGWDPRLLRGEKRPDRQLLDEIFPERPVALESRDFHTLWCNTAALRVAGILDGRMPPAGGEIGRAVDGSPDGLLYETAWELILQARPPEPEPVRQSWLKKAIAEAHSFGLTSFHSMEPLRTYQSYRELARAGELSMRVVYHSPVKELDQRIAEGQASYCDDDPWLRLGGVKIFADGSLGSASAYMLDPYPGGGHGRLLVDEPTLTETIVRAGRSGIAPSIHAIGDAAMRVVVNALLEARASLRHEGKDLHPLARIEHAQCVRPEELRRMSSLSLSCAMQLVHLMDDLPLLSELWPTQGRQVYRARALMSHGVRVVLGSDAPVASIDPRQGVCAAITRQREENRSDGSFFAEECLSEEEALLAYTRWAAQAAAWDEEVGSLGVGKLADLVALEAPGPDDPYEWKRARIRMTMVDGKMVYDDLP